MLIEPSQLTPQLVGMPYLCSNLLSFSHGAEPQILFRLFVETSDANVAALRRPPLPCHGILSLTGFGVSSIFMPLGLNFFPRFCALNWGHP
jgi:hypothetical protein